MDCAALLGLVRPMTRMAALWLAQLTRTLKQTQRVRQTLEFAAGRDIKVLAVDAFGALVYPRLSQ